MEAGVLPENIGPYRVIGHLGRGGMGEVLRGYDDRLARPVAIKRVQPNRGNPEKARRRFRREARAVAQLSDGAIVQVYDWVEEGDQDWLVMELVDGRPLNEVLVEGLPSQREALIIAREIASGLAAAHEAGIIHRDLKAANVMLVAARGSAPSRVKILDFGIAKQARLKDGLPVTLTTATELTEEGQFVGTISAMSPEQAMGRPVDHRSDLFSLGTLLYEMLSGESPFVAENTMTTLSRICSFKQPALHRRDAQIPQQVSELVDHLLQKDPAHRPTDARQVVAELGRLLAVSPDVGPDVVAGPETTEPDPVAQVTTLVGNAYPDLADGSVDLERTSLAVAESESSPVPDSPISKRRGGLMAGVVVVAAVLWGVTIWQERPIEESTVQTSVSAPRPPAAELSNYELYQRGMKLLERYDRKGNVEKAIEDFQRILARDGSSAAGLAGLSTAYRLDYDWNRDPQILEQALAAAEKAVQLDEHLSIARTSRGMAYFESGLHEDAARDLKHVLGTEPSNSDALFGLAKIAEAQNDLEQAEQYYLRAIEAQSKNWLYPSHLGALYYGTERYEEAAAAFLHHGNLAPDSFVAFRNLGAAYSALGRFTEAVDQFQKALVIRPDHSTYSNLGTIQFSLGQYPQAVSAFEKARDNGGVRDYLIWGNLGDAYRWVPDSEDKSRDAYTWAIRLLKGEIEKKPQDTNLSTLLPLYLAKRGDCGQALVEISNLDALPLHDGEAWFQLAVTHEVCDDREAALAALGHALQARFPVAEANADPELKQLRQDVRYQRLSMIPESTHDT